MKNLKLGKMTGQEIAEWMGISFKGTYSKNPKKYLSQLDNFCDYEKVYGGVVIKEIYQDTYDKNIEEKYDKLYIESLVKHNNLITVSGTAEEHDVSRYYMTKSRNRLFGNKPANINLTNTGLLGQRTTVWAIKLEGTNNYRMLTVEEDELFDNLIKNVYGKIEGKQTKALKLLEKECAKQKMTVAEFQEIRKEKGLDFFGNVLCKFKETTGYQIVSATQHDVMNFFDGREINEKYREKLLKIIDELKKENAQLSKQS